MCGKIDCYIETFSNLRTDKNRKTWSSTTGFRAPHKPFLLLSVLDHIAAGLLTREFFEPAFELAETFAGNWQQGITGNIPVRKCNQIKKLRDILIGIVTVLLAVMAGTGLSSCTMISKEMLPGVEYRENPQVEIIVYNDFAKLQEDCAAQFTDPYLLFKGCSLVPHDPREKCVIRVMAGDEKTRKHEVAHCHGHADTLWPWQVDTDFYRRQGRNQMNNSGTVPLNE